MDIFATVFEGKRSTILAYDMMPGKAGDPRAYDIRQAKNNDISVQNIILRPAALETVADQNISAFSITSDLKGIIPL